MSDRDIMHLLERADAADRRMQHLQEQIGGMARQAELLGATNKALMERIIRLEEDYAKTVRSL